MPDSRVDLLPNELPASSLFCHGNRKKSHGARYDKYEGFYITLRPFSCRNFLALHWYVARCVFTTNFDSFLASAEGAGCVLTDHFRNNIFGTCVATDCLIAFITYLGNNFLRVQEKSAHNLVRRFVTSCNFDAQWSFTGLRLILSVIERLTEKQSQVWLPTTISKNITSSEYLYFSRRSS